MIDNIAGFSKNLIKRCVKNINPILLSYYKWNTEISENEYYALANNYQIKNYENLSVENKIIYKKYAIFATLSINEPYKILLDYKNLYLNGELSQDDHIEFCSLLSWIFSHLGEVDLNKIKSEKSLIDTYKNSIKSYLEKIKTLDIFDVQCVFFLFDVQEINEIYILHPEFIKNFKIEPSFIPFGRRIKKSVGGTIINSMAKFMQYQNLISNSLDCNVLIQQIIIYHEINLQIDIHSLKIDDIAISCNSDVNEYQAVLLLATKNFTENHFDKFVKIINNNVRCFLDEKYLEILIFMLDFPQHNIYFDQLLSFINRNIDASLHNSRIEFESFLYTYVSSKLTDVNDDHLL